jgi:predicted ATPase
VHASQQGNPQLPEVTLTENDVFPGSDSAGIFFSKKTWDQPVSYFVGRNGSGKSRTARLVAERTGGRILSTDRLAGLTLYTNYGWTSVPANDGFRGIPLGGQEREQARGFSQQTGSGIDEMYALKEQPEVWLRVAAFLRRALGRVIELRENAGFLDPYIRVSSTEYSLLRDEGHGLRELVILLTAVYREDWTLLVVDEPELHLHPSMARLWLSELERVCRKGARRAIVVTHEPSMVKPAKAGDLESIWLFATGRPSHPLSEYLPPTELHRVTASLINNPQLVSQLVFSPRPVLVEGVHDVTALTVALSRTHPAEAVAQTDFIECGGSGAVALWFEISRSMGLDVRAVADLDACLAQEVQRVMDRSSSVTSRYRSDLSAEPATTSTVIRPLIEAMNKEGVGNSPKERAKWLSSAVPPETGWASRSEKLRNIWKDEGLWLHAQGTLEDVLGVESKGREIAQQAAGHPGAIDEVAAWCAYELDPLGDVETLLGVAVERIAHSIMEALRADPSVQFDAPVGGPDVSDARLVSIKPSANGFHLLTVRKPDAFAGYWLEFSRDTPSSELILKEPGER